MEDMHKVGDKLGVDWKKINYDQFCDGMETEEEHKDITKGNKEMTAKIVLAHLKEIPDYYTRLEKMEENAKKDKSEKEYENEGINLLKKKANERD